ncbi:hypothetical protein D3C85_1141650 [compost metagenome]
MIAFMVAVVATVCLIFGNYWAIVFLIFDFGSRAFTSGKFSVLKYVAVSINQKLALPKQMKDLAPKKFAATLGFVFCLLITAMFLFDFPTLAMVFTAVMLVFAYIVSCNC